jgi:hypothetical protein
MKIQISFATGGLGDYHWYYKKMASKIERTLNYYRLGMGVGKQNNNVVL